MPCDWMDGWQAKRREPDVVVLFFCRRRFPKTGVGSSGGGGGGGGGMPADISSLAMKTPSLTASSLASAYTRKCRRPAQHEIR